MARIFFYKLTADTGGAPCVDRGLLSLAICKPMIRASAKEGDLIFGFAANSLHRDNRLIYVARVTRTLRNGEYYKDERYAGRGDCIYKFQSGHYVWRSGALHHGPNDIAHDLGEFPDYSRANVLLSTDFRYFGRAGNDEYKSTFPLVRDAVERLGQGERVHHDPVLYDQLLKIADWVWETYPQEGSGLAYKRALPENLLSGKVLRCGKQVTPWLGSI
jgi:hypothetical protein